MDSNLAYQETWQEEIIGGKAVMMAPAQSIHNLIKMNISAIFYNYLRGKRCTFLPDGEGLILEEDAEEYIPDGMVVCAPEKIKEDAVHGVPDLVIEVLSPGTARYDRGHKYDMYEKYGVREYWIVSPGDRTIEQYILANGSYDLREIYHRYSAWECRRMKPEVRAAIITEFKCSLFDDLLIRVNDVFERVADD